jgi:hypothetical protein
MKRDGSEAHWLVGLSRREEKTCMRTLRSHIKSISHEITVLFGRKKH